MKIISTLQRCISLLFLFAFIAFSKEAKTQTHTAKSVSINGNCKGYYEYLPVNYSNSSTKFPLMIYCGGAGSFGNGTSQISRLLAEGVPYYINNKQFPSSFTINGETSSYIVISPQFINWPEPIDVENVIDFVINQGYKVDQSRIYLTGFSAGGDVTWMYPNTSLARSKRLAALVPVSGYNYPYVDSGAKYIAAANLPVWALHSRDDGPAPSYWSQNFVNKINSYNPPIRAKISLFSGPTHDQTKLYAYNPTFRDGGYNIYEWMLLYRRGFPPVAQAGPDASITLPTNTIALNGSNSYDPENGPISYKWVKIAGPSQYSVDNTTIASPTISNLVAGIYDFELTVTDNGGLVNKDVVRITVINPNSNQLPQANAGNDISIPIPQNSVALSGSASSDGDGIIEKYSWTKLSGPAQFAISSSSSANTNVTNLAKGTYIFRLTVTDNEGGTSYDDVEVQVYNPNPNTPPVSNAGSDQVLTLPTSSTTLNGTSSYDADGTIIGYVWSQVSGPSTASIASDNQAITSVSNLIEGTYVFNLSVMDDSTAFTNDVMEVKVMPKPPTTTSIVKVNLYAGSNPFNQDGWNNWNASGETNITSPSFKYSDGSSSTISSVLSYSQGLPDNGANYGGTVCPPQVLRYTSYSTAATRTLTIRGLNNSAKYGFEFYASRATTGNKTTFVINGVGKIVNTDNNKTESAVFTDITPVNGQITISINKTGTFSYINGFVLTETVTSTSGNRSASTTLSTTSTKEVVSSPNPFRSSLQVTINNSYNGKMQISLINNNGKIMKGLELNKVTESQLIQMGAETLPPGIYYLQIKMGEKTITEKIVKLN